MMMNIMLAARSLPCRQVTHAVARRIVATELPPSGIRFRLPRQQYFQSNTQRCEKANKWPSDDSKSAFVKSESAAKRESRPSKSETSSISDKAAKTASFMSRSMQDVAGRLSSSTKQTLTSATQSAAKSITNLSLQATSKAANSIISLSSQATSKTGKSITNLSSQATSKATESAKKLAFKATDSGKEFGSKLGNWAHSLLDSMQTRASELVSSFGSRMVSTAKSSLALLWKGLQRSVRSATSGVVLGVEAQVKQVTDYVESSGGGAVRKIWWWSLAAIGVYGIATTVPKELIRVAFDKETKQDKVGKEAT